MPKMPKLHFFEQLNCRYIYYHKVSKNHFLHTKQGEQQ